MKEGFCAKITTAIFAKSFISYVSVGSECSFESYDSKEKGDGQYSSHSSCPTFLFCYVYVLDN